MHFTLHLPGSTREACAEAIARSASPSSRNRPGIAGSIDLIPPPPLWPKSLSDLENEIGFTKTHARTLIHRANIALQRAMEPRDE
jgi:hypothetical protein